MVPEGETVSHVTRVAQGFSLSILDMCWVQVPPGDGEGGGFLRELEPPAPPLPFLRG